MLDMQEDEKGVVFRVRVQPRASKNSVAGLMGSEVKLRLTAPPVDGEANKACLVFLASVFRVPKKQVELVSGQTSRSKRVRVYGIKKDEALKALGI